MRDIVLSWPWGIFANRSVSDCPCPCQPSLGPGSVWRRTESQLTLGLVLKVGRGNPGPGARKREAEKRHLDPLMLGTDACPLSQGKGDPQDGFRNRRSSLWETSCNSGIFCVGVLGERDDREQLLPNQICTSLPEHRKAPMLTLGCGERKCSIYCRDQARSPDSFGSKHLTPSPSLS